MSHIPFSFAVVRYVHDQGTGESLNVGVVLFAARGAFLAARVDIHFERLSTTFCGFSGEHYRRVRAEFLQELAVLSREMGSRRLLDRGERDAASVLGIVWPDRDLSFSLGPVRSGVTSDPERELDLLFERMVRSQAVVKHDHDHRDDEDVWRAYRHTLPLPVRAALRPKKFVTAEVNVEFERSFKNERWHAIEPISFDYKRDDTIQRRATEWVGLAAGLEQAKDLAKIYFLLGAPQEGTHKKAYEKAKNLLRKVRVRHEIVEEDEAADFASNLESYMRRHGVI